MGVEAEGLGNVPDSKADPQRNDFEIGANFRARSARQRRGAEKQPRLPGRFSMTSPLATTLKPCTFFVRVALLGTIAVPALAQESKTELESITVTAERRSENIKDVPNSVSAVRGELLDVLNSGGQDVRVLAARVPSLNIESSFGRAFPRFYVRGLGNTDFDLNASQPVSLLFDDVVQENRSEERRVGKECRL